MKHLFHKLASSFNAIITLIAYLYRFILRGTMKPDLASKLSNGKDVIVLGNGPSVKQELSHMLSVSSEIVVVNFFACGDYYKLMKPRFYVLSDGFFFSKKPIPDKAMLLYNMINDQTCWEMSLYVPYWSRKNVDWKKIINNPFVKVLFYNDIPYCGKYSISRLRQKLYNKGVATIDIWNVIHASIMLMIYNGYENIHLYGVESNDILSIIVTSKNQVGFIDKHFYDGEEHPFRMWYKENGKPYTMPDVLYKYYKTFLTYHEIAEYAQSRNCKIFNHTKDSLIDSFERIN